MSAPSVMFEFARGEARLGPITVAAVPFDGRGAVQINGPEGPVLRPLQFGERTRIVARAAASSRPREELCFRVLAAATARAGSAERCIQEIVALALAGAGPAAPAFDAAAMQVSRAGGWKLEDLETAIATDIDRMARAAAPPDAPSPWRRIVLLREPSEEVEELRAELADSLLRRLDHAAGMNPQTAAPAAARANQDGAVTQPPERLAADWPERNPEWDPAVVQSGAPREDPESQALSTIAGPARAQRRAEAGSAVTTGGGRIRHWNPPEMRGDVARLPVAAQASRNGSAVIGPAVSHGTESSNRRAFRAAALSPRAAGDLHPQRLPATTSRAASRREPIPPASADVAPWSNGGAGGTMPSHRARKTAEPDSPGGTTSAGRFFPKPAQIPAFNSGTASDSLPGRGLADAPRDWFPAFARPAAELVPAQRADMLPSDALEWADRIALLLDEEADLRGIDR